jgi:hypothetical protein
MGSGQVSGSIDHQITQVTNLGNQELFTSLFRFFNGPLRSGSYCDLHALHTGSTTPTALGTDYHDENTPFGNNAFAVFKFPSGTISGTVSKRASDMYVLIQWADTATFGASPGNPGLRDGGTNDGVGWQCALRDDGGDPWTGTTLANGDDRKGATPGTGPVWTAGGSTVRVLPRSNNTGGTHNTNKENCINIQDQTTNPTRYYFFADRDNILIYVDISDNQGMNEMCMIGVYDPIPGLSGTIPNPVFMMHDYTLPLAVNTVFGSTAGNNTTTEGGIIPAVSSSGVEVRGFEIDRYASVQTTTQQPNLQYTPTVFDEFRLPLFLDDTDKGMLGYVDFWNEIFGSSQLNIYSDGSKIIMYQMGVPWVSGTLVPPQGSDRAGRFF